MKTNDSCKGCEGRDKLIESLERRIVMLDKSLVDGIIESDATAAALYREGDIEKFFGCSPDFTGDQTTAEYLAEMRDEK